MPEYEWNVIEIIKYEDHLCVTRKNKNGKMETVNLNNRFIDMIKIIRDQELNG